MDKKAHLSRELSDEKQTLGVLTCENGTELFVAKTLELKWDKNINDVSCIPTGIYRCIWSRSSRLSTATGHDVFTYEVTGVPGRAGIRIHSANYFFELKGCIALGNVLKDINIDGELDVIHSGDTVAKFNEIMKKEPFTLIID